MPRVELPLIGPAYKNRELPLSAQVTKNLWPEINPEARNVVALHNAAGIRTFSNPGGADRGSHDFNNLMYVVMGQTLSSVDADGVNLSLGTIEGSNRTVMADDGQQLIIVTGDKPYRYTVTGGVEEITDPDLVKPTSVAYINQQFIFDQNDGIFGEFVTSSIDPDDPIDALDFAIAESHPDDIIRVLAFRQLIWFFGSHSVEPWSNIGVGNPPWSRVDSGIQLYGLAGTHGVVATNKYMYFLDSRRIPRRSSGLDFVDIGTPAIGVEFAKYSKIDDLIVFEYVQDNQQFVAYTFPTANRTWVFHEPSGSWFQLASGIGENRHRASSMLNIYGLNYCNDHSNGLIYEYSLDIYSDNGDAIIKQRDTAIIHGGLFGEPGKNIEYNMVEIIIVSGETEVAGTGLGPQPATPFEALTDCNEVWEIGTLLPDLHVAGVVAGVYDGDLITGTGELEDDRVDNIHTTNDTDNYTRYAGFNPGVESGVAKVFFPDCQWYDYAGPLLQSVTDGHTYNLTDAEWTNNGAYGTEALDALGISGLSNRATTVTDNSAVWFYQLSKFTTLGAGQSNIVEQAVCKWKIRKESVATHHTRLLFQNALGAVKGLYLLFNVASGVTRQLSDSDADNMDFEVRDNGDWWEVIQQMDTQGDGGRLRIHVAPSWNADGSDTQDSTATGSVVVGDSAVYIKTKITLLGLPTIGGIRGGANLPANTGASQSGDISNVHIPAGNHSDTEGGYYFEWRPMYSHSEISRDVEILSLNDSTGLLYYDYSEQKLTSTDGTNTATVDLVLVAETKYRLGVIWGDHLRVGVDQVWGNPVDYDGGFPGGSDFTICRNPEAVNYWRELRGFQIPYLEAFDEIDLLMNGGSGSELPDAPDADPQVEIMAPFWENIGNWIDLSALTQTTFASMFGVAIEDADFNSVIAVNKAALVNTNDAGNRIQLQDSLDAENAALFITDASGNVIDSMIYDSTPNGSSVLVPTGANYYVVITSDTGNARVRKWDTTQVNTIGSTPWEDFFPSAFSLTDGKLWDSREVAIPLDGIAIAFTIPATSGSWSVGFVAIPVTGLTGTKTGNLGQVQGAYTADPTFIWGLGGGLGGGINFAGQSIDMIPGETYFFNIRNDNPKASGNFVRIKANVVAQ